MPPSMPPNVSDVNVWIGGPRLTLDNTKPLKVLYIVAFKGGPGSSWIALDDWEKRKDTLPTGLEPVFPP